MSERPRLTVVVVSYNTRPLLDACLASLQMSLSDSIDANARIIVVDNGSSDESVAMVRTRFPDVRVIVSSENLGFGRANNLAAREIDAPYVLFLNPDTETCADTPTALVQFLEERPEAGLVGGRLIYPDGRFQHSAFRFPGLWQCLLDIFPINHRLAESRLNGRFSQREYASPFEIDHPLGASMMVRRAAFEAIGGFDERYFMYCEELDLCRRLKNAGWQVWFTPTATTVHHAGAATSQFRRPMTIELFRSRHRFFRTYRSPAFVIAFRAILLSGLARDLLRGVRDRRLGRIDAADWARRREFFHAVIRL